MKKIPPFILKSLRITLYSFIVFTILVSLTVFISGDSSYQGQLDENVVTDITQLNPVHVNRILKPESINEIVSAIKNTHGLISIGGGRYSMGGQTAIENSLHLDMRNYNKVVSFSKENREITVESGITWRKLQQYIDKHDLSVKIMQTYANFSVGGSMSVNVHGRYIGHGPLISSIKSFSIILADGSIKTASPELNPHLFYSAIGGYGGIGVISEVTLYLENNTKVERKSFTMDLKDYKNHFKKKIRDNKKVIFHNADLYPPNYDSVRDVSWYITDKDVSIDERIIPEDDSYWLLPKIVSLVSNMPFGKQFRQYIFDPVYYMGERIAWRNWEASYDVRELGEGDRSDDTYVLHEYFIPLNNLETFVPKMREIFQKYDVDVLNVSIRHALADSGSYLAWAREEVFAFVMYYHQETSKEAQQAVATWTREIIDAILTEGGSYYLPYQPHATLEQFKKAYPGADKFYAVKQKVDPDNRFQNKLWEKYYPSNKQKVKNYLDDLKNYYKGEEQTYLTMPEWYLVFNPNEYADFLKSGNNPSDFPFFSSIDEYWTLYDRVNVLTKNKYPENSEYQTMLQVIGISTTAEFLVKGLYENIVGRFTRWTASADTEEDLLIQQAHTAYAKLIYSEAWYKFPFFKWVLKIWSEPEFFAANFIRKIERKISFTLEFTFKSLYALLIGFGAETAYEQSDGLVTLRLNMDKNIITSVDNRIKLLKDFGNNDLVISLPRWGTFSEIIPKLVTVGAQFTEISGNDDILISVIADKETNSEINQGKYLFSSIVISPENKTRLVYTVNVANLSGFIENLNKQQIKLEHIYDY